jgi:hypothetical protein
MNKVIAEARDSMKEEGSKDDMDVDEDDDFRAHLIDYSDDADDVCSFFLLCDLANQMMV